MRALSLVALSMLVAPLALDAQRLPRPGTMRPTVGDALPPQPEIVARAVAYKRLRIAFETYPLISFTQTPAIAGNALGTPRASFGVGARAEYRVLPNVWATLDATEAALRGSTNVETLELGTRIRPTPSERRVHAFVDLRVGGVRSYEAYAGAFPIGGSINRMTYGGRTAYGLGGVAGVGMDINLTQRFDLTTGASMLRTRMSTNDFRRSGMDDGTFTLTSYRLMVGLRYNPVRLITAAGK